MFRETCRKEPRDNIANIRASLCSEPEQIQSARAVAQDEEANSFAIIVQFA